MQEVTRAKMLRLEVAAVIGFFCIGSLPMGWTRPGADISPSLRNVPYNVDVIAGDLGVFAILAFLSYGSGDPPEEFGLRPWDALRDVVVIAGTALVAVPIYLIPLIGPFQRISPHFGAMEPITLAGMVTATLATVIGVMLEEFVFRGLLISRLKEVTGKPWLAVLISAVAFAVGHAYQGVTGVAQSLAFGLVAGIAFHFRPSIWPLVVIHAATNLGWMWLQPWRN